MPYYKLLEESDAGDVEIFEALSVECLECREETIVRLRDGLYRWVSDAHHKMGCNEDDRFSRTRAGWGYAFGSEGFQWYEPCEDYNYKDEIEAIIAAVWKIHKEQGKP